MSQEPANVLSPSYRAYHVHNMGVLCENLHEFPHEGFCSEGIILVANVGAEEEISSRRIRQLLRRTLRRRRGRPDYVQPEPKAYHR